MAYIFAALMMLVASIAGSAAIRGLESQNAGCFWSALGLMIATSALAVAALKRRVEDWAGERALTPMVRIIGAFCGMVSVLALTVASADVNQEGRQFLVSFSALLLVPGVYVVWDIAERLEEKILDALEFAKLIMRNPWRE